MNNSDGSLFFSDKEALRLLRDDSNLHDASIVELHWDENCISLRIDDAKMIKKIESREPQNVTIKIIFLNINHVQTDYTWGLNGNERSIMWIYSIKCTELDSLFEIEFKAVPAGGLIIHAEKIKLELKYKNKNKNKGQK